jgi:hypothetical protein
VRELVLALQAVCGGASWRLAEQQAPAAALGELRQVADRVDVAQWVRERGDPDASQYVVGIDVAEFIAVASRW